MASPTNAFWLESTASERRASQCSIALPSRHLLTQSVSCDVAQASSHWRWADEPGSSHLSPSQSGSSPPPSDAHEAVATVRAETKHRDRAERQMAIMDRILFAYRAIRARVGPVAGGRTGPVTGSEAGRGAG